MKKITKLTSFILTLALILGLTSSLTACKEETLNGSLSVEIADNEHIKLMSSDVVVNSEEGYLEKTLTATVLPDYLPESDKKVDWFVLWGATTDKNISDYLTVNPTADGSNVCAVRCYKAFDVPAIVYAKTRIGGYTAKCSVEYVGIPSNLDITCGATAIYDESVNEYIYEINEGDSLTFDLVLSNALGVSTNYTPRYNVTDIIIGTFKVTIDGRGTSELHDYYLRNNVAKEQSYDYNMQLGEWERNYVFYSEYLNYRIENNKLIVNATTNVEGYKGYDEFIDNEDGLPFSDYFSFYSYYGNVPYVRIRVADIDTGVTKSICVRVLSYINDVSLDSSTITF